MAGNGRRMTAEERTPLIGDALHKRNLGHAYDEIGRQLGLSEPMVYVWINSPRWADARDQHRAVCEACRTAAPIRRSMRGIKKKSDQADAEVKKVDNTEQGNKVTEQGNPIDPKTGEYVSNG